MGTDAANLRFALQFMEYVRSLTASMLHESQFNHPMFSCVPLLVVVSVEIFL